MNPTCVSHAILAAADSSSVRALAAACSLSPSTLSKLVSTDRRIDPETLRALCTRTAPHVGLAILLEHLRDEVERAGRAQTEVAINATGKSADDDLAILASELVIERQRGGTELRSVLHDLANLVRNYRRATSQQTYPEPIPMEPAAAEDGDEAEPPAILSSTVAQEENRAIARELAAAQPDKAHAPLAPKPIAAKKSAATKL